MCCKTMRRFRKSSETKRPVPLKPAELRSSRKIASLSGRLLKVSWRTAHIRATPMVCVRERKPPTIMMGNRYRNPREMYGLVSQSVTAMAATRNPAVISSVLRFADVKMESRSFNHILRVQLYSAGERHFKHSLEDTFPGQKIASKSGR